jgi:hypothetical protein
MEPLLMLFLIIFRWVKVWPGSVLFDLQTPFFVITTFMVGIMNLEQQEH